MPMTETDFPRGLVIDRTGFFQCARTLSTLEIEDSRCDAKQMIRGRLRAEMSEILKEIFCDGRRYAIQMAEGERKEYTSTNMGFRPHDVIAMFCCMFVELLDPNQAKIGELVSSNAFPEHLRDRERLHYNGAYFYPASYVFDGKGYLAFRRAA